jgi:outer membrane protein OmpA-like peptidoglycan-associated protein
MAQITSWTRLWILTGLLAGTPKVLAQEDDLPPPPPPPPPAEAPPPPPPPAAPPPASGTGQSPAAPDDPYASDPELVDPYGADPYADGQAPEEDPYAADATTEEPKAVDTDYEAYARKAALRTHSTLTGSTGLMRVREAGGGPAGSFRVGFQAGMNGMGGFLCTETSPCPNPSTGLPESPDSSQRFDTRLTLAVTPFSFLEAYAGMRSTATSNSLSQPSVLQVVGDWNLGVKGFLPTKADRIYSFGGELDMFLLNGLGGVGFDGGATSFTIRGLGSLDLTAKRDEKSRLPLRFHTNLAYQVNNSAAVLSEFETTPPSQGGRGRPVERPVRYGLGISRVDAFEIGLGAEYVNKWIRPYLEWTIEMPVNRQGYVCNVMGAQSRGDECLGIAAGFNSSPSRLTLGAVGYPWQESGLSLSFAIDIGTGGTSVFLEETTPEAPYTVWLGVAYAVDVVPPKLPELKLEDPAKTPHFALGRVIDEKSGLPVADAKLRFVDDQLTGMIAGPAGTFKSQDLPPGTYELKVEAEGYVEGVCKLTIPETAAPSAPGAEAAGAQDDDGKDPAETALGDEAVGELVPPNSEAGAAGEAGAEAGVAGEAEAATATVSTTDKAAPDAAALPKEAYLNEQGEVVVPVVCALKELPQVATVTGLIVDARSGAPVADAAITVTDKLGRSLKLDVDAQGAFQFRNVPLGSTYLTARAPGYLTTVSEISIARRGDVGANLVMNKLPTKPGITVSKSELVFSQPITFIAQTSEVAVESMTVIEELAYVLEKHPEIARVEVQVHTDDAGSAAYQRRTSQDRADKIKLLLTRLGIQPSRLSAKGYGPDQPLAPNVSEANRARNRRVQVVIGTATPDALGI